MANHPSGRNRIRLPARWIAILILILLGAFFFWLGSRTPTGGPTPAFRTATAPPIETLIGETAAPDSLIATGGLPQSTQTSPAAEVTPTPVDHPSGTAAPPGVTVTPGPTVSPSGTPGLLTATVAVVPTVTLPPLLTVTLPPLPTVTLPVLSTLTLPPLPTVTLPVLSTLTLFPIPQSSPSNP